MKMECSNCNKPLSIPPIYHNDSIGSICGRCTTDNLVNKYDGPFVRQIVFEDAAKYLCFPCSYQVFGCKATLKWDSVECHENTCGFNNIVCPLSHEDFQKQCSWVGEHNNLAKHIKEKHNNMYSLTMKITNKLENRTVFWEIAGQVIIIMLVLRKSTNMYSCCISGNFTLEQCSLFQCQINIFGDDLSKSLVLQLKGIQPFEENDFEQCEECFQIDVDSFKHLFSTSDEVTMKFNITEGVKSDNIGLNENMLLQLECPICMEYMKPPIFICRVGHNICQWCSNKIEECPICRGDLSGGRNFTLEAVTALILYPCSYKHFGCSFAALIEEVREHERFCLYVGRKCFMDKCTWKGVHSELLKHLPDDHPDKLLQLNTIHNYDLHQRNKKYLMLHNKDIFLLKISSIETNGPLELAVLHYEREERSYSFKFKILGCSPFINIALSNCCQPVPLQADIMTYDNHNVTSLPFEFTSQFWFNFNQMEFKMNIMSN